MLEEYIRKNYEEAKDQLDKENRKLKECQELEKTVKKEIREIQQNTDIDFEIFSPRAGDGSLKGKVKQLYENLDLLRTSISKLQSNIEVYTRKTDEFTIMKEELRSLKNAANHHSK